MNERARAMAGLQQSLGRKRENEERKYTEGLNGQPLNGSLKMRSFQPLDLLNRLRPNIKT